MGMQWPRKFRTELRTNHFFSDKLSISLVLSGSSDKLRTKASDELSLRRKDKTQLRTIGRLAKTLPYYPTTHAIYISMGKGAILFKRHKDS